MRIDEWEGQMRQRGAAYKQECCRDCPVWLTCGRLNRQDTTELRKDDDALCALIADALDEAGVRKPGGRQQPEA